MTPETKAKILKATNGSKFGAILTCAMDPDMGTKSTEIPRFTHKATVTSDGFVMCNFIDKNGDGHMGAFVGAKSDLLQNIEGLARFIKLSLEDERELKRIVDAWMGVEIIHVKGKVKPAAPEARS
jgi:hypothetical protein